ncbi:MAG: hypothetical protein ABFS17_11645, partial [Chloroflexota bacterium]
MKSRYHSEKLPGMLAFILILVITVGCSGGSPAVEIVDREPGAVAAGIPDSAVFSSSEESQALIDSIAAAGDYILKYQLSNGALSYRVDLEGDNRDYNPSHIRLIAGTGAIYTVCRVTGEDEYCQAGDRALAYYLNRVVDGGDVFGGACFYAAGTCKIGGAALAVDAIYKRWLATGETMLDGDNLLDTALQLGDHMVWMRNPSGGFNHMVDPFEGGINPEYFVIYFNGESLMALLEIYEMTGDEYWLEQAHEINRHMLKQSVTQDHWHAYSFMYFAKLDKLSHADQIYATRIAQAIISYTKNLADNHSTISTATKVEALAAIAIAFQTSGNEQDWLPPAIKAHADFIIARQLPNNICELEDLYEIERYAGGIYYNC